MKVSKKRLFSIMIFAALALAVVSGQGHGWLSRDYAGTAGAQFLKLGAGAREGGMGEIGVGVSRDVNGIYWNPAGLNYIERHGASFMQMNWLDDISYSWAGYAVRVEGYGVFGLGLQNMSYGSITETNEVGAKIGSFEPGDSALTVSYAREFGEIKAGAGMKYISSRIKHNAEAAALDIGIMYEVDKVLSVGAKVENIGTALRYIEEDTALPMSVKGGIGYRISKEWLAGCDITLPSDNDAGIGIGTEYGYGSLFGRIGYNTRTKDIGGLSGISVGAGWRFGDLRLDYSYQPYEYMGEAHRFSLMWTLTAAMSNE